MPRYLRVSTPQPRQQILKPLTVDVPSYGQNSASSELLPKHHFVYGKSTYEMRQFAHGGQRMLTRAAVPPLINSLGFGTTTIFGNRTVVWCCCNSIVSFITAFFLADAHSSVCCTVSRRHRNQQGVLKRESAIRRFGNKQRIRVVEPQRGSTFTSRRRHHRTDHLHSCPRLPLPPPLPSPQQQQEQRPQRRQREQPRRTPKGQPGTP